MERVRVATDVGGTFTDMVAWAPGKDGVAVVTAKADTTPQDGHLERGVMEALRKGGVDPKAFEYFAHGTTAIINALTERKGVKTAMVCTHGFRDTLEIARGNRPDFFDLDYKKPPPFCPRHLRFEVRGRLSHRGAELSPLELDDVDAIAARLAMEGPAVEAVAICLLHSYANPEHEARVAERLRALLPDVAVVASHEVTREWREYERGNTAVLSAYVAPIARQYLAQLTESLSGAGMECPPYIMQSSCGVDTVAGATARPISIIESGPSSGVWASAVLGELLGESNVLSFDIGGTTAKCSLVPDGQVQIKTEYHIEKNDTTAGYPILVPVVDIVEIGQGGGSIAWVEKAGDEAPTKLRVGPQSAGASPGPVAYGRGGSQITTTDANLVLGRISPNNFCGELTADMPAVRTAMAQLATELGMESAEDAARGIVRIANANMVNALKLVSVNRGYDPRDFTLVAYGGGGGMHAAALAREIGINKLIVPKNASVFSAWGMLVSDLRRDYVQTHLLDLEAESIAAFNEGVDALVQKAEKEFADDGIEASKLQFETHSRLRYQNQEHTIEVATPRRLDSRNLESLLATFHAQYEREYTYRLDVPVELVAVHLVAKSKVGKLQPQKIPTTGRVIADASKPSRRVDFDTDGVHDTAIFDGELLEPGMEFAGPAIVESSSDVVVVYPGMSGKVDGHGNVHISCSQAPALLRGPGDVSTDPITEDIIQSALQSVASEMFVAMQRTAMSAIIYEVL